MRDFCMQAGQSGGVPPRAHLREHFGEADVGDLGGAVARQQHVVALQVEQAARAGATKHFIRSTLVKPSCKTTTTAPIRVFLGFREPAGYAAVRETPAGGGQQGVMPVQATQQEEEAPPEEPPAGRTQ